MTAKIHACLDALGNPLRIEISGGQVHDSLFTEALLAGFDAAGYVIADCAYDADRIRVVIAEHLGAEPVIPSNPSRPGAIPTDEELYKERHLIECVRRGARTGGALVAHSTKSNATGASH